MRTRAHNAHTHTRTHTHTHTHTHTRARARARTHARQYYDNKFLSFPLLSFKLTNTDEFSIADKVGAELFSTCVYEAFQERACVLCAAACACVCVCVCVLRMPRVSVCVCGSRAANAHHAAMLCCACVCEAFPAHALRETRRPTRAQRSLCTMGARLARMLQVARLVQSAPHMHTPARARARTAPGPTGRVG